MHGAICDFAISVKSNADTKIEWDTIQCPCKKYEPHFMAVDYVSHIFIGDTSYGFTGRCACGFMLTVFHKVPIQYDLGAGKFWVDRASSQRTRERGVKRERNSIFNISSQDMYDAISQITDRAWIPEIVNSHNTMGCNRVTVVISGAGFIDWLEYKDNHIEDIRFLCRFFDCYPKSLEEFKSLLKRAIHPPATKRD